MNIGETIKNLRIAKNMTQEELAAEIGVSRPFVTQIERGTKIPTLLLCVDLARVLGCDITDLLRS